MTFEDLDWRCINTIRTLSADTVQKANSGHPGAPMGCAPMAHVLFSRFMNFSPGNPHWGPICVIEWSWLCAAVCDAPSSGAFRQLDSKTPGHPEVHMTDGIEVTTGPLGQGIAQAVGLAIAEAHLAERFNKDGFELFDNYTFVVLGDGCMQEGVASEACSLAGHLGLGKLILLYDDNNIQIDGSTDLAFTEDVMKRYESYGFHVLSVENGDSDLESLERAIEEAKRVKDKPSMIKVRTTIGFGSKLQGTEKVHGNPLGKEGLAEAKKKLGFDENEFFHVPKDVQSYFETLKRKGAEKEGKWNEIYAKEYPELAKELKRRFEGKLPEGWKDLLPVYSPEDAAVATRKLSEIVLNKIADKVPELLSEIVLNKIADKVPELVGGSADLTHSNLTKWKTSVDFQKKGSKNGNPEGRYFRFGVREHAMAAIVNGLAAYGGLIPFGATFLNFITYAWGAVRLSALSHLKTIYIMTHDSIGLGEDGPTHQPIETVAALRALPNMLTIRPADGNETSGAYAIALEYNGPSTLCLTRQNVPHLKNSSIENTMKGGYILNDVENPQVILVGTGSEVSLCVETAEYLKDKLNIKARVVSMPCVELFEKQSNEYKKKVFSAQVPVVSVEAMSTLGWHKYSHFPIGIDTFGASAPYQQVYKKVGLSVEAISEKVSKVVSFYKNNPIEDLISRPF
ncbi:Transketolase domain-containing protein [Rozella allomycis CSF55]|uniref:transketolase n=1 Tax=Rozella allomycis (strain CSF55) TaxID=988480 RepID=A0A075APK8_ROZAC|nr:Transketolase domain-containing protein [Rozella allomycis CSF55]|eukprot:EPZ32051.1 Transketolase domain-containing protein [Rozella allomycis CSF55]